jgi:type VI protein secretion system component Hcp
MKSLKHFSIKTFLAFTILGMAAVNAHAATVDYFLKIDGIAGESVDIRHKDWIDINSFAWGVNSVVGGKATFSPLSWTQQIDRSVTSMIMGIPSATIYKSATLDVQRVGDSGVFFSMQFDTPQLTKLNISGTGDAQTVAAALDGYGKITMTYRQQQKDGSLGTPIAGGWDLTGAKTEFFGSATAFEGLMLAQPAAVPVPAAVWLLGSGLLGLIGVARRKAA